MLFPASLYDAMREGRVTVAFRCWKRPTVKSGGTLLSPVGLLAIDAVDPIEPHQITDADALAAGASSGEELRQRQVCAEGRHLYRIAFRRLGDDPRIALRARHEIGVDEQNTIGARLGRLDAASVDGAWTTATLALIGAHPGVVARELASVMGLDQPTFKRRVRQLKSLGLTESLAVGYRISPRGQAYLGSIT